MNLQTLHQVGARIDDFDASIAFYRDLLGAKFLAKIDPPGLVLFEFSGTRLLLEKAAGTATLYFQVDDISTAYKELTSAGVSFEGEPHLIFQDKDGTFGPKQTEEWMAFFEDPGGNTLALVERRRMSE